MTLDAHRLEPSRHGFLLGAHALGRDHLDGDFAGAAIASMLSKADPAKPLDSLAFKAVELVASCQDVDRFSVDRCVEWINAALTLACQSQNALPDLRRSWRDEICEAAHNRLQRLQAQDPSAFDELGASAQAWQTWDRQFDDLYNGLYHMDADVQAEPVKALLEAYLLDIPARSPERSSPARSL